MRKNRKLTSLCNERAVREQRSSKDYFRYLENMDVDDGMAVVPDDNETCSLDDASGDV